MKAFGIGLVLHIVAAAAGLSGFVLLASYMNWIDPVWWGGKALFVPIIGTWFIAAAALPTTIAIYLLSWREQRRGNTVSMPLLGYLATGFLNGTLCLPVGFFGAAVASQWNLNAIFGAVVAFVFSVAMCVLVFRPHVGSRHAS